MLSVFYEIQDLLNPVLYKLCDKFIEFFLLFLRKFIKELKANRKQVIKKKITLLLACLLKLLCACPAKCVA